MKAAPVPFFVMIEADLLLEILVIAFDHPAPRGGMDQALEWGGGRQVGQPILGRLRPNPWPFDKPPFVRPGLRAQGVAMAASDASAAKREESAPWLPERQVTGRQARLGTSTAGSLSEIGC